MSWCQLPSLLNWSGPCCIVLPSGAVPHAVQQRHLSVQSPDSSCLVVVIGIAASTEISLLMTFQFHCLYRYLLLLSSYRLSVTAVSVPLSSILCKLALLLTFFFSPSIIETYSDIPMCVPGNANRGALWMAKPEKVQFLHEHLSKTYCKFADNIKESMENPGESRDQRQAQRRLGDGTAVVLVFRGQTETAVFW